MVGAWRSYERTNADGRVESHRLDESLALDIESAIRAPYEELVKAARDARSALVLLTSELSGQMGYIEGLQQRPHGQPQRTINYAHDVHAFLTATLTRIEESLGGRS